VEVDQTSICGSDLHFYWGDFGDFSGVRPGREFLGTVVAVGKDVTRLRVGDRAINMALYGCGHCGPCQELRPTGCMRGWVNFGKLREIPGRGVGRRGRRTSVDAAVRQGDGRYASARLNTPTTVTCCCSSSIL
jgi:threonine dehydrogenase-like Zn-dependent dehydrogenase